MNETRPPELNVSIETAEAYFDLRLRSERWKCADLETKQQALTWASRIIQNGFEWNRGAYTAERWSNAVQFAVCEQALWVLKLDPSEYPAILTKGIVEGVAQPVSAKFSKDFIAPWICYPAKALIGELGTCLDGGYGSVRSTMLETV